MALDLLVARATLDPELRQELLSNPEALCLENGIQLPEGTRLIFTSSDSSVILKEIPLTAADGSGIQHTGLGTKELVSNVFNNGEEATETNTTTAAEAEVTAAEVQAETVTVGPTTVTVATTVVELAAAIVIT